MMVTVRAVGASRRRPRDLIAIALIALAAGTVTGLYISSASAQTTPRPQPAPPPPSAPPTRTPQPQGVAKKDPRTPEELEKLKKRVLIVRDALSRVGVTAATLKIECGTKTLEQLRPEDDITTCGVNGYGGTKLAVTGDRFPGVKGFWMSSNVPDAGAAQYRVDREKMVENEMKKMKDREWEVTKPGPDSLLVTQKYYRTGYQWHSGHPHAKVNGEVMLCDLKAFVSGEVMGKQLVQVNKNGSMQIDPQGTEAAARALGAQLQLEVMAILQALYQGMAPASECTKTEEVELPELPLVIPVAALEGTIKEGLLGKKSEVQQLYAAAKQIREKRTASGKDGEKLDTFKYLVNWHTENRGLLDVEVRARAAAEEFFWKLGSAYDRMTDGERGTVETKLMERALALRRYRTVQRGVLKEKAGKGLAAYTDLDTYYTAVARANWAGLELLALVRMMEPVTAARLGLYGNYDVYELSEARPDPQRVAAVEGARRRHVDTLVDMALGAVLGAEIQYDVMMEARKDRLFGLKEIWGGEKLNPQAAEAQKQLGGFWTKLGQGTGQLFNSGFGLFDVVAGAGADAFRSGLYYLPYVGDQFKTRAEKLEQQVTENWDKTLQKLLLLRLLKQRSLTDIRQLAEYAVARGLQQTPLASTLSPKLDPAVVPALIEDRAFVEATDGGLHRLLGAALIDLRQRGRMELRIATEKTRLVQRDMEFALRAAQGQDPDTGDLAWGTILSPSGWIDVASKGKGFLWRHESDDFRQRGGQINLKSQQALDMFKLDGPLLAVEYDFEQLTGEAYDRHVTLWERSAPYIGFVQRMREERRARYLHGWRRATDFTRPSTGGGPNAARVLDALARDPEVGALKAFHEELIQSVTLAERKAEMRRALDLTYEDHIYAWDLPGALGVAMKLRNDTEDPAFAKLYDARYRLLLASIAWDRVKEQNISWLRNAGDAGFTTALFGATGLTGGPPPTSFGRFFWETVNPFAAPKTIGEAAPGVGATVVHSARAVLTQSVSEVLVADVGVPGAGQKYEALLNQTLSTAIASFPKVVGALKKLNLRKALAEAVAHEQKRYAELDGKRYLDDLYQRAIVQTIERILAHEGNYLKTQKFAVRLAFDRLIRAPANALATWSKAHRLLVEARLLREAPATARPDKKAFQQRMVETLRALELAILPPSREYYDWLLQTRLADFFDTAKGRDIDKLRQDFKVLRKLTRPEDRPALDALEARIDQERSNRFTRAMAAFMGSHGGQIEGVILNGTRAGNPEYKGLFSDRDFTIVTKPGVDPAAIKTAVEAAFKQQGVELIGPGCKPTCSADMEAMVQPFLPGDVKPIKTIEDFAVWAREMTKDPHRYLTAGGSEWVGLYNYLNGATVAANGGVDAGPNAKLLPQPDLHPMFAFGLVLDNARFDLSLRLGDVPDAKSMGDLIGARAKYVMRAVDALIWALHPDLLKARTPADAQQKGYHALIVEDAKRLADDKLLTPREFQVIQLLEQVKTGKSIFQVAGDIRPGTEEAHRALLDDVWTTMDGLMKRSATEARAVYLDSLDRLARDVADDPKRRELLFTLAFRNWNAARFIGDSTNPGKFAELMGFTGSDALARMRIEDQLTIGLGTLDRLPGEPPPAPIRDATHPLRTQSHERPAEGAEPVVTPVALKPGGAAPPPPRRVPREELFDGTYLRAYVDRGDGYLYANGEKVAVITRARGQDRFELIHDVVAFGLGRLLDVNVPHAERVLLKPDGPNPEAVPLAARETVLVTRVVPGRQPGRNALVAAIVGKDAAGNAVTPPAGLTREQHLQQLRAQYIGDRLLSSILGDAHRGPAAFDISPEGQLFGQRHDRAQAVDPEPKLAAVAEQTRRRLEGEGYGPDGDTDPRARGIERALKVRYEDVEPVWQGMKDRLFEADGSFKKDALQQLEALAAKYGDKGPEVLAGWKKRIRTLDAMLGRVHLPDRPAEALRMGHDEFHRKPEAQRELFTAARWMRNAQEGLARAILEEFGLSLKGATALLKRDKFEDFRDGILEKVHRKEYDSVSKMDDIARGRFNVESGAGVEQVIRALETNGIFDVVNIEKPKVREGVEAGYPRYHVILKDKRTGLTFEWQVGTQRTTDFFELPGFNLHGLKLKEGMKPNIHDIEYDVFKYLQDKNPTLATELGIPAYRKKVAEYAARTLRGPPFTDAEFTKALGDMHQEGSTILKALLDHKDGGHAYVQGFFH